MKRSTIASGMVASFLTFSPTILGCLVSVMCHAYASIPLGSVMLGVCMTHDVFSDVWFRHGCQVRLCRSCVVTLTLLGNRHVVSYVWFAIVLRDHAFLLSGIVGLA